VGGGSQEELRQLFAKLVEDDMPMVRRAAASNLGPLAECCSMAHVKSDLLPLFARLVSDEQDNVRPLAVEASLFFGRLLSQEDALAYIVHPLHAASKDRSWRVRYVVAEKYSELETVLGNELSRTEMAPMLVRLLQDQEKEVRTQAALRVPHICKGLDLVDRQTIITTNVMRHVTELCADQSQHVRVAMAGQLLELGPILGKEKSIELLVPLFVRLLKDDYSDVRLNIISKLDVLQTVVGKDVVANQILTEVAALADDPQWRVRLAICEQMPSLGKSLGRDGFDTSKLSLASVALNWLSDNVFAIRNAAATTLADTTKVLGEGWAKEKVFPKIAAMGAEKAYLSRLTALVVITKVAKHISGEVALATLLPTVLTLTKDKVPNVRFNAARALESMAAKLDKKTLASKVKPRLEEMVSDTDTDVKYYSSSALVLC
jgi:serine/threonine-protein phosphatase 2A regulatory subunit A